MYQQGIPLPIERHLQSANQRHHYRATNADYMEIEHAEKEASPHSLCIRYWFIVSPCTFFSSSSH